MAESIRTIKGDITVNFADKSTHTFENAGATVYEGGVLRIIDSDNVERYFSPSNWGEVTTGAPRPPRRAGTVY